MGEQQTSRTHLSRAEAVEARDTHADVFTRDGDACTVAQVSRYRDEVYVTGTSVRGWVPLDDLTA